MPKEAIEEAENPSLKIIGTPLVLKIFLLTAPTNLQLGTIVTMPYTEEKTFEEGSIALYAKTREGWDYLESKINKENKTITANITDIANYLDNESKAVFAVMGVLCTFCTNSSLELIYEPEPKSKDAIIMVHGFASSPATYQEIIDDIRLTNQPFTVFTFGYPSSKSLDEVADEFSALTEAKSAEFDNIYIVAHSTGGLITQQALYSAYNKNYSYAQKTRKLILVGVPNEGAPVFEVYQDLFKKLIKVALFVGLFLVIFIVITSIIFPETRLFEKGKNYILGKTESILDTGKDKVTAYVIKESNETINNAKDKILESID